MDDPLDLERSGSPGRQTTEASADGAMLKLESFLPYRLSVLTNSISRQLATQYEQRFGLKVPEWRVMANLGRFGPMSALQVSRRSSMDKAKVSRAIARMTKAGLVTRDTDPADNRMVILKLSTRGKRIYEKIVPLALDWERDLLAALSMEERRVLDRALAKLQAHVADDPVL